MTTLHEDCQKIFDQVDKDLFDRFEKISEEILIDDNEATELLAAVNCDDKAAFERLVNTIKSIDRGK